MGTEGFASTSYPSLLFAFANACCLKLLGFLQDFSRLSQLLKQSNLMRISVSVKNSLAFLIL